MYIPEWELEDDVDAPSLDGVTVPNFGEDNG